MCGWLCIVARRCVWLCVCGAVLCVAVHDCVRLSVVCAAHALGAHRRVLQVEGVQHVCRKPGRATDTAKPATPKWARNHIQGVAEYGRPASMNEPSGVEELRLASTAPL